MTPGHESACTRQMIDAIREILGLQPLYAADPCEEESVESRLARTRRYFIPYAGYMGDGNRRVPRLQGDRTGGSGPMRKAKDLRDL